jgi:cell division protein FtsW (lipid II flippase)
MAAKKKKGVSASKTESVWSYRKPERKIFMWSVVAMTLGFLMFWGSRPQGRPDVELINFLPLVIYAGALALLHGMLLLIRFRGDPVITGLAAMLAGTGILAQSRMGVFVSDKVLSMQHLMFPAGIALMFVMVFVFRKGRYRILQPFAGFSALIALGILVLVLALGQRYRGAVFGPGGMTPTETLKILVVVFLSGYLALHLKTLRDDAPRFIPPFKTLFPLAFYWGLLTALLVIQRDLGLVVILSLVLLVMLYAASHRPAYIFHALFGIGGFGYLVFNYMGHSQRRLNGWLDPFADAAGAGWQVLQGLSGMYSGGLWGVGFGAGNPHQVPIAESDFIYAVIAEEMGFVGCIFVMTIYLVLIYRGFLVAQQSDAPFGSFLATGLIAVIAVQTFLNVGGVTKLIPVTGITLPLISHGGSSLITNFASLGLLLAISEPGPKKKKRGGGKKKAAKKRSTKRVRD